MCSSLKINTACHRSFVFIVDFDHNQHINSFSSFNFEQVFVGMV